MFLDRDNTNRRQKQLAYRNQLKNQIQMNNSKLLQKSRGIYGNRPDRQSGSEPQTFGLLKNIQIQQQTRKNKQSEYYAELRNQIEKEKQEKRRKKQQQAQKEKDQEDKLIKENQMLRQRAEREKQMENNKGKVKNGNQNNQNQNYYQKQTYQVQPATKNNYKNIYNNDNSFEPTYKNNKRSNANDFQQRSNPYLSPYNQNVQSRLKTSQSNIDQSDNPNNLPLQTFQHKKSNDYPHRQSSYLPTYPNKIQNESFNFLPQRRYMDSYFQQLLGQRRRFQQEASQISQLNKILYQEKSRAGKIKSRGLDELKKLQFVLDEKGSNYMSGYGNGRKGIHSSNNLDNIDSLITLSRNKFPSSSSNFNPFYNNQQPPNYTYQ